MGKFCKTHIGDRSRNELMQRRYELTERKTLGPRLTDELARIEQLLGQACSQEGSER